MQGGFKSGGVVVSGFVARDAETRLVGQKQSTLTTFSIAADKRGSGENIETVWANCKAWHDLGRYAAQIRKGDHVLAAGKMTTNTDESGKVWKNLECDFLIICPTSAPQSAPVGGGLDDFDTFDDEGTPF